MCSSPPSGPPVSPGVGDHVIGLHQTPASLQTAVGSTWEREQAKRSRKHQEKVPTPRFGTSCTSLCQLAGAASQGTRPKEPVSARPGPDLNPQHGRVWLCQAPACMKCSSHQKEQIQRFILSTWCPEHGGRGRTHPHSPCPADTSIPASSPVHRCHHITQMCSPQKATRHLGCVFLQPKSHDCHQGEKNSAVRTSETKKDASLGCFFSIRFFFFMKKDHTEFSNKQNAKKIVLNKT